MPESSAFGRGFNSRRLHQIESVAQRFPPQLGRQKFIGSDDIQTSFLFAFRHARFTREGLAIKIYTMIKLLCQF